jgi:hypothetical protein
VEPAEMRKKKNAAITKRQHFCLKGIPPNFKGQTRFSFLFCFHLGVFLTHADGWVQAQALVV